jgi:hypothetical protein
LKILFKKKLCFAYARVQFVGRHILVAETRVRFRSSKCEIFGRQTDTERELTLSMPTSLFLCHGRSNKALQYNVGLV